MPEPKNEQKITHLTPSSKNDCSSILVALLRETRDKKVHRATWEYFGMKSLSCEQIDFFCAGYLLSQFGIMEDSTAIFDKISYTKSNISDETLLMALQMIRHFIVVSMLRTTDEFYSLDESDDNYQSKRAKIIENCFQDLLCIALKQIKKFSKLTTK